MCTVIGKTGNDAIYGFNMDIDPAVWDYAVYAKKDMFYIGIKVGKTVYKVHGVNSKGQFAVMPYMNGEAERVMHRGGRYQRLDLLVDGYIAGKFDYAELERITAEKTLVNIPGASMHGFFADGEGHMLLAEPGVGVKRYESFAAVTNFPTIEIPEDTSCVFYGYDRYETAADMLSHSGDDFTVKDAFEILRETVQTGQWATRVSFVYSKNENAVYYCTNRDFDNIICHRFI